MNKINIDISLNFKSLNLFIYIVNDPNIILLINQIEYNDENNKLKVVNKPINGFNFNKGNKIINSPINEAVPGNEALAKFKKKKKKANNGITFVNPL